MTDRESECGGCELSRRAFVERSALAALATMLMGACGDGQIGGPFGAPDGSLPPVPGGTGALVVDLADFPELEQVGGTARVDNGSNAPIGLSRTAAMSFVAVSMICPHAGFSPINIRPTGYRCPNHGALFDDDGTWTGGQRTSNLQRYVATFDPASNTVVIT